LPPYGAEYLKRHPDPGVCVAIGRNAWSFARSSGKPMMVLPATHEPAYYQWPASGQPALIHELGAPDDERLTALARELLTAGNPSVVAIRHSMLSAPDCRVYFEAADDA
jgi:hypothetical protein